ncbi:MAG: MSMEG_6728 family protein [Actinomycetota bacterium]|nr:MSMEG_6728 family protein [Actinomycetota bacterium]
MQTFLPYPDFERSARALDVKRLGKQRVEVIQVVRALTTPGYGWANHPAVLMWKGHEEALGRYGLTCCEVWLRLGYGDTCAATITADLYGAGASDIRTQPELAAAGALPAWLGDEDFHRGHQSALVQKDPAHYGPIFPGTPDDLPYLWPVRSTNVVAAEQRRAENAVRRAERARVRAEQEVERLRRRRSRAAKQGWRTRRAGS